MCVGAVCMEGGRTKGLGGPCRRGMRARCPAAALARRTPPAAPAQAHRRKRHTHGAAGTQYQWAFPVPEGLAPKRDDTRTRMRPARNSESPASRLAQLKDGGWEA